MMHTLHLIFLTLRWWWIVGTPASILACLLSTKELTVEDFVMSVLVGWFLVPFAFLKIYWRTTIIDLGRLR